MYFCINQKKVEDSTGTGVYSPCFRKTAGGVFTISGVALIAIGVIAFLALQRHLPPTFQILNYPMTYAFLATGPTFLIMGIVLFFLKEKKNEREIPFWESKTEDQIKKEQELEIFQNWPAEIAPEDKDGFFWLTIDEKTGAYTLMLKHRYPLVPFKMCIIQKENNPEEHEMMKRANESYLNFVDWEFYSLYMEFLKEDFASISTHHSGIFQMVYSEQIAAWILIVKKRGKEEVELYHSKNEQPFNQRLVEVRSDRYYEKPIA